MRRRRPLSRPLSVGWARPDNLRHRDVTQDPVPIVEALPCGMRPSRLQNSLEAMAKSSATVIFSTFSQVRSMA